MILLLACSSIEPLDLPEDPAAWGVPIGVTQVSGAVDVEVWYPAAEAHADDAGEEIGLGDFVPENVADRLGNPDLPTLSTRGVRDAAPRETDAAFPVVVFSHGFGGFRMQSLDYVEHLASRGYAVAAIDHEGRRFEDVLPCLFSPPLDGCAIETEDPGPDQVPVLVDVLEGLGEEHLLGGRLDLEVMGLSGHSAGGATTATLGETDERFSALFSMAAPTGVDRDVPFASLGGSCDPYASPADSSDALVHGHFLQVLGAGHMAFSDMCQMDIAALAEEHFGGRDDLNEAWYAQLLDLATNGCEGAKPAELEGCADGYLDLSVSAEVIRYASTSFFDAELLGAGDGPVDGVYAELTAELR